MPNFSNIRDLINSIESSKSELIKTRRDDMFKVAFDYIALLRIRLANGTNADGNSFTAYSPRWARDRNERGRQIEKKDYNDTGQLYRNISPQVITDDDNNTIIEIAPSTQDDINKVAGALNQGDEILRISRDEQKLIENTYLQRRIKRIKF